MAINVSGSLKNNSPLPDFFWSCKPNTDEPWDSVEQLHAGIPLAYRSGGKFFFVLINGVQRVYSYQGGKELANLLDVFGTGELKKVPVFLMFGESNSAGEVVNTALSTAELAPRPKVKILASPDYENFETLDIPTNNSPSQPGRHGWENGVADMMEWGSILESDLIGQPNLEKGFLGQNVVYVVKTGRGSTHINEWSPGEPFDVTIFKARINTAKLRFAELGLEPVWYGFYSQGINDGIDGTALISWKKDTKLYFDYVRRYLGPIPIFATRLMPRFANYNILIDEIAQEDHLFFPIATNPSPSALMDIYHWNYAEMKEIAKRMFLGAKDFGFGDTYGQSIISAAARTTNIVEELPSDAIGDLQYATWTSMVAATQVGNEIVFNATAGAGGVVSQKINPFNFTIITKFNSLAENQFIAIALRNNAGGNFTWNASRGDISLFYIGTPPGISTGRLYITSNGSSLTSPIHYGPSTEKYPVWIKMVNSGDDIVYSRSYDGVKYEFLCRQKDALWGITDYLYINAFLNVGAAGKKVSIQVTKESETLIETPVDWNSFTNASQTDDDLLFGSTTPSGAKSTSIDATSYFEIITEFFKQELDGSCVVFLSEENTANYAWSGLNFVGGYFHNSGSAAFAISSNGSPLFVTPISFPVRLRMHKDGNDLVYSKSYNNEEFREAYRDTDRLLGKTTLYLKALCAAAPTGKRITVNTGSYVVVLPDLVVPSWFAFVNATQAGDDLAFGNSLPTGGMAGAVDTKLPFEVITSYTGDTNDGAVVVFLDNENAANYVWASGQNFIGGHYVYNGNLSVTESFPANFKSQAITLPALVKMSKENNDLVVSVSNNNGASYVEFYRFAGKLAFFPIGYIKALCTFQPTGKKINVEATLIQPPKPLISKGVGFFTSLDTTGPTQDLLNSKYSDYDALSVAYYPNQTGGAKIYTKLGSGGNAVWMSGSVNPSS